MIHVLLANEVVTEAATLPSPSTQPVEARVSESESAKSKALSASSKRPPRSFLRTCLVLVPKNVLRNWQEELEKVLYNTRMGDDRLVVFVASVDGHIVFLRRGGEQPGPFAMLAHNMV